MNKLTSIRIKQNDGTYSDDIPVQVLADNVVWTEGSTVSLTDILGQVKYTTKGSIQHQLDTFSLDEVENARVGADDTQYLNLKARLDGEYEDLQDAIAAVAANLQTQTGARSNADTAIRTDLSSETTSRINGDNLLSGQIVSLSGDVGDLEDALDDEVTARQSAINSEVAARNNAINSAIASEVTNRNSAIATEATARASAINAESSARQAADTTLQNNINVEKARIDQIASLPSGSTSGDAELQDIRVKINGVSSSSAGNAVREQFNDVISSLIRYGTGNIATLFDKNSPSITSNGVTMVPNSDGSFSLNGTASGEALFHLYANTSSLPYFFEIGKEYLCGLSFPVSAVKLQVIAYIGSSISILFNSNGVGSFTIPTGATGIWIRLSVPSGTTISSSTGTVYVLNGKSNRMLENSLAELDSEIERIVDGSVKYNQRNVIEIDANIPSFSTTRDGITIVYNKNGSFTLNGTATGGEALINFTNNVSNFIDIGKQYIAGIDCDNTNVRFQGIAYRDGALVSVPFNISGHSSSVFSIDEEISGLNTRLSIPNGVTVSNVTGKIYILTDTSTFYSYSSGQIHFNITVNSANMVDTESPSTYADFVADVESPSVLILPTNYSATGKPVPLLMICHGSGYAVSNNYWGWQGEYDSNFEAFVNNFVNAGYAVCDTNGLGSGVQSTWGAPRAIQAYRKLYEWVTSHYNVQHELNIYGFSMGGINALNFAANNGGIVKVLALGAPVTSLFDQVYNYNKGRKEGTAIYYNFTLPSGFDYSDFTDGAANAQELEIWNNNLDKTIGFDPTAKIIQFNNKNVLPFSYSPIRIWHAKDDTSVSYIYSQNFVDAIRNANNYASIRLVTTGGHGISYGENSYVTEEIIRWINRFNVS